MTPEQIRDLRSELGESTTAFGARFARGFRAVEEWEQGRRKPDPLVTRMMHDLYVKTFKRKS